MPRAPSSGPVALLDAPASPPHTPGVDVCGPYARRGHVGGLGRPGGRTAGPGSALGPWFYINPTWWVVSCGPVSVPHEPPADPRRLWPPPTPPGALGGHLGGVGHVGVPRGAPGGLNLQIRLG